MNSSGNNVFVVLVGVFSVLIVISAYRRRDAIAQKLRWLLIALGSYALTILIVKQLTEDPVKIMLSALLIELIVMVRTKPRRSRYIPRSERRKAIAKFERTGQRYDPKKHHIDHVVPHRRGGSNRAENLRVIEKDENLAKSDRSPWWDVFG